jgi:hypothetical protein
MIKKLFIQLLFIGFSSFAFSQEMTVTGFVKSEQNVGLPFVKVQVKGVTTGVTTDGTGFYRLKVSDAANSILLFTFTGYEKQEVKLNGRSTLDIVLIELVNNQKEVVVGYGTAKSREVTGATSKVDGENERCPCRSSLTRTSCWCEHRDELRFTRWIFQHSHSWTIYIW